jgi:hypothetical protein
MKSYTRLTRSALTYMIALAALTCGVASAVELPLPDTISAGSTTPAISLAWPHVADSNFCLTNKRVYWGSRCADFRKASE